MTAAHSVWLLCGPTQEAELQGVVDALAGHFEGHRFVPHLTLQGDLALPLPALLDIASGLAAAHPVQHWPVSGLESTPHFFRSLYLRLDADAAFEALARPCSALAGTREGLSPYPHVSLAYGRCNADAQALHAQLEPRFRGRTLSFERIAVCRSSKLVPIAQWAVLAEYTLRAD